MPISDGFIDGVFNYCDRWCERCPLTARCRLFAMEQAMNEAPSDADNAAFWAALDLVPSGVQSGDLGDAEDSEENESWRAEREFRADERVGHPLAEAGMDYGTAAHRWLRGNADLVLGASPAVPGRIAPAEAFDVLNWYCLQIGVKLARALAERDDADVDDESWDTGSGWQDEDDDNEIREAVEEASPTDRAGSTKVALIGIERSLGAWTILRDALPEHSPAILDFLRRLGRLRRAIDEQIPEARTFRRPGFDDEGAAA
jgi:hypothetical protein